MRFAYFKSEQKGVLCVHKTGSLLQKRFINQPDIWWGKTSDLDIGFVINLLIKAKGKLEPPIRHKEITVYVSLKDIHVWEPRIVFTFLPEGCGEGELTVPVHT